MARSRSTQASACAIGERNSHQGSLDFCMPKLHGFLSLPVFWGHAVKNKPTGNPKETHKKSKGNPFLAKSQQRKCGRVSMMEGWDLFKNPKPPCSSTTPQKTKNKNNITKSMKPLWNHQMGLCVCACAYTSISTYISIVYTHIDRHTGVSYC